MGLLKTISSLHNFYKVLTSRPVMIIKPVKGLVPNSANSFLVSGVLNAYVSGGRLAVAHLRRLLGRKQHANHLLQECLWEI